MTHIPFQKIDGPFLRDPNNPKVLIEEWRNPVFGMLADAPIWVASEKIDGTNINIRWDGYRLTIGGRTAAAQIPKPLLAHLEATFLTPAVEEWFEQQFPIDPDLTSGKVADVVLFGEGYGPGIQKGGKYREDVSFIGFDVYVNGKYLSPANSKAIFESLGVDFVPEYATPRSLRYWIDGVSQPGFKSEFGDFTPEGLVVRTIEPLYDQRGNRIIVKIKPENVAIGETQ